MVAPYSGVVAARLVEVGEMVTVGKPLMIGFDPAQMRVIVNVPQYKLADIGSASAGLGGVSFPQALDAGRRR